MRNEKGNMLMFDKRELLKNVNVCVDFTLLSPLVTEKDIKKHCNIALKHHYYGVCINPVNVKIAKRYIQTELLKDIKVCTVIGYPLGENVSQIKIQEAKQAISDGVDELDVVISISRVKSGDYAYVKNELTRIVRISKKRVVKAIIETGYLTREEINKVVKICLKCRVDYIQTSTGYTLTRSTPEEVNYLDNLVGERCGIKIAGGVTTKAEAIEMVRAGAQRIGTSRII